MKNYLGPLAVLFAPLVALAIFLVVVGGIVPPVATALAEQLDTNEKESLRALRTCTMKPGLPAKVSAVTSGSVSFAAMSTNTVILFRCEADVYFCTGTSACTATTNHFPIPPSIFPQRTTETIIHFGVRAVTTNGTCWAQECN